MPSYAEPEQVDEPAIDFSDLEAQYAVDENLGLENYVVVDGAPIAPAAKAPLLEKVLRKFFSKAGPILDGAEGMNLPVEDGKTKGYLFVQFADAKLAAAAVLQLNGKPLDAKHTLLVNKLLDIDKFCAEGSVADEFEEPPKKAFENKGFLRLWLQDEAGRDQLVLQHLETVQLCWFNKHNDPVNVIEPKKGFTSKYVKFSPRGLYLFLIHPQGVQLWGGRDMGSMTRFVHPQVRLVDFSRCERYMVSLSPVPIAVPEDPAQRAEYPFGPESEGHKLVIWDLQTGEPVRTFALPPHLENQKEMPWPLVKWSFDDKYCCRQGPDALAIYESPLFQLLDKKLVKIPDVVDFEWAPAGVHLFGSHLPAGEHVLLYWTPESANKTAKVALMQIPLRQVVRTINLFQVSDCKMHWLDDARALCVKVDRHSKSGKTVFSNLEFFRTSERDIPVEKLELKEVCVNFAWEPRLGRFVTITRLDDGNNNPAIAKNCVTFYATEVSGKNRATKFRELGKFENRHSNTLVWAPKGRYVVVATISKLNSELEFFDVDFEENGKREVKLLKAEKYPGMTNIAWDPSGRYVGAWLSLWVHLMENGCKVYEFTGAVLRDEPFDQFKELLWRPRPALLLTEEHVAKVKKLMKEYSARFDEQDAMEADAATREAILKRRRLLEEWKAYRAKFAHQQREDHSVEAKIVEEIKEQIIEEKEEVV